MRGVLIEAMLNPQCPLWCIHRAFKCSSFDDVNDCLVSIASPPSLFLRAHSRAHSSQQFHSCERSWLMSGRSVCRVDRPSDHRASAYTHPEMAWEISIYIFAQLQWQICPIHLINCVNTDWFPTRKKHWIPTHGSITPRQRRPFFHEKSGKNEMNIAAAALRISIYFLDELFSSKFAKL